MSQDQHHNIINYLLVGSGTTGFATAEFWQNIDLGMSVFLKFISLASFICFLLINQDKISSGYTKVKERIRKFFKRK